MPRATRPLNICIATVDFPGPIRNGGIGSAYASMAQLLAGAGHRVTVLYGLGSHSETAPVAFWRRHYRRRGIDFVPVPAGSHDAALNAGPVVRSAHAIYRWLRGRQFDVLHVHEWRGAGYFAALGRQQGLCLEHTPICVGVHSPSRWAREGMGDLAASVEDLEVDHMERESIALADVAWSPSRHMLEWLARHGWRTPRRTFVRPNVYGSAEAVRSGSAPRPVNELVFFGRQETRKGFDIFCGALARLQKTAGLPAFAVTFLGKPGQVGELSSAAFLRAHAERWAFPWRTLEGLQRDEAVEYLRGAGRLAVLPSRLDNCPYTVLECLGEGIAFLASRIGGIPEIVHRQDADRVLFALDPVDLASRLAEGLKSGVAPARPAIGFEANADWWVRWHESIAESPRSSKRSTVSKARRPPKVSVCVTHHNRPQLLGIALESIRKQTYGDIEVVLVDDSDDDDAIACVDGLQPEFANRRWQIIRQVDQFVGAARNAAIRAATGDYILLMDDDNVAKPEEVATFVTAATASGADVLTCFLHPFTGTLRPQAKLAAPMWPFLGGAVEAAVFRNVIGDTNSFFHRRVFERVGAFSEERNVGFEDWELLARALLSGCKVQVVPEALVYYRCHTGTMSARHNSRPEHQRALRPYLASAPADLSAVLELAKSLYLAQLGGTARNTGATFDHVRKVVVFGGGRGGQRAICLARRCGWEPVYVVDNNESMWGRDVEGVPVSPPARLADRGFDLIVIASMAGRAAITEQLRGMGFDTEAETLFFLDPVNIAGVTVQISSL